MAVGLDVQLFCNFCYSSIKVDSYRKYKYRKGQKSFYCNSSCKTSYMNKFNNPMFRQEVREKLSKTSLEQGKWSGSNNPNFGGENIRDLWNKGFYKNRDITGRKNPGWIDGRSMLSGKDYRGSDWRSQKFKALNRDNNQCIGCNSYENLVVHHIVPYAISKDNSLSNLKTLCRKCHGKEHMKIGWNYFKMGGS